MYFININLIILNPYLIQDASSMSLLNQCKLILLLLNYTDFEKIIMNALQ